MYIISHLFVCLRPSPHGFTVFCLQISTLQNQIHSQESDLQCQEEELSRAKADLGRLQQEENQLEQSLAAGKIQLETIIKSLKATQDEINQVGNDGLFAPTFPGLLLPGTYLPR